MLLFFNSSIEELLDIIIVEAHCSILSADSQYKDIHKLQRRNTENSKNIFPEKELRGLSPNFHIHVSVSVPTIGLPILLQTRECGNWDWCRAIPFLEIPKKDFRRSALVPRPARTRACCTVDRRPTSWATQHPSLSYAEPCFFYHRGHVKAIVQVKSRVLEIDIYPSKFVKAL